MKLFLSLALALGAHSAGMAQSCPATVDLALPNLGATERRFAQAYANCLTDPTLTSTQGRIANLAACRANMPPRRSAAAEQAMRQVEQTAINLGDCRTRITIKAKAQP
jgi:hypothetical protein